MADAETAADAAHETAATPTRYDRIAYPSGAFARMGPNRMQIMARLHGIGAAPIETARVLEIGGNDGLNLTAFAAAFPRSDCLSFDLAAAPVERGRALAQAAGIGNVRIERLDILAAAADLPGEYDYVIAHGVYAWVPPPVRQAILALIGRVLAPNGVAAISYNTLPGHVLGQTLREMVQAEVGNEPDDSLRFDRSMAVLRAFGEGDLDSPAKDKQDAFLKTLRVYARELMRRPEALLAHDELGGCYEPQAFGAVCAAAQAVGLTYLNDALYKAGPQGFSGETDQAALIRQIQTDDYRTVAFFRHSLFIREGVAMDRQLDLELLEPLWLSSALRRIDKGRFVSGGSFVDVSDDRAATILVELERRHPERLPLAGLQPAQLRTFADLFLANAVSFATGPNSVPASSECPRLSPLARAQIERGDVRIATLEQEIVSPGSEVCRFMLLFDGERDITALAAEAGIGVAEATAIVNFLGANALLTG